MQSKLFDKFISQFEEYKENFTCKHTSPLRKIRQAALSSLGHQGLPTIKDEQWKYTNLTFLNQIDFNLPHGKAKVEKSRVKENEIEGLDCHKVVIVNGRYNQELSDVDDSVCEIMSINHACDTDHPDYMKTIARYADYKANPFIALNTAFAIGGVFLNIGKGKVSDKPIHIMYVNDGRHGDQFCNPRNLIYAHPGSNIKIIESYHPSNDAKCFCNNVTEIIAERDSNVEMYTIQNGSEKSYIMANTVVHQQEASTVKKTTISIDGKFIRNDQYATLSGKHADTNFFGFYYADRENLIDNHTFVDHTEPDCTSNENYKGIIADKSTAVFNGKILVRPDAQHTNAFQSNKNVLMSDMATINTKPELEIYADDVKCSHGATSGALDEDALYYLKTRGIKDDLARALLLKAFSGEITTTISIDKLRNHVEKIIENRIEID